jgi:hypothetical protein
MHMACLGVMRKLLNLWINGSIPHKISSSQKTIFSDRLLRMGSFMPSYFNRKTRSIKEFDRFKATEFRFIMLYAGPILLKDLLNNKMYIHFLKFHTRMRILLTPNCSLSQKQVACNLLREITEEMQLIYDTEQVIYNVHCICSFGRRLFKPKS